jgi:nicotinamide riboside kinase
MLSVIIGRRRQGKSTLALSVAKSHFQTTIVFDPNDQYGNLERIDDIAVWMENTNPQSIGRIVPIDPKPDFEQLAAELDGGSWKWGDYVLIVDECSMLMSPSWVHPILERYARTSPKDVSVILTTHRTVDVHTLFRALATDWFFFNQHLDRDLENISDNFGAEIAQKSKELPNYHLIHFWLDSGGVPKHDIWDKPEEWFIDIGRKT